MAHQPFYRNVIGGVAGLTADANSLVNFARNAAQKHLLTYNEDIPVELLAQRLCDMKQGYTQFGGDLPLSLLPAIRWHGDEGLRPFGVSILYAGYDPHYEFQLYHSDPSGNYSGWKATCIGANNGTAQSLLKQEYKDDIVVKDAIGLVLRTMSKTMDSTTLNSEKRERPGWLSFVPCWHDVLVEFAVLTLDPETKQPKAKIYRPHEIDALLSSEGLTKKDEDTEMK
jgi:20S proteasome subunit alpha 3